jgi:hypothetical protein
MVRKKLNQTCLHRPCPLSSSRVGACSGHSSLFSAAGRGHFLKPSDTRPRSAPKPSPSTPAKSMEPQHASTPSIPIPDLVHNLPACSSWELAAAPLSSQPWWSPMVAPSAPSRRARRGLPSSQWLPNESLPSLLVLFELGLYVPRLPSSSQPAELPRLQSPGRRAHFPALPWRPVALLSLVLSLVPQRRGFPPAPSAHPQLGLPTPRARPCARIFPLDHGALLSRDLPSSALLLSPCSPRLDGDPPGGVRGSGGFLQVFHVSALLIGTVAHRSSESPSMGIPCVFPPTIAATSSSFSCSWRTLRPGSHARSPWSSLCAAVSSGAVAISTRLSWGLLTSVIVYIVAWLVVIATSSLSSKLPPRMLGYLIARLSISRSSRPMPQQHRGRSPSRHCCLPRY